MEKIHISIIGTCILRDTFGFHEDNGGYIIDRFVQTVNPIAAVSKNIINKQCTLEELMSLSVFGEISSFNKRNCALDLNKQVFDYLSEVKSEWLIIDTDCLRTYLFKVAGEEMYFTKCHKKAFDNLRNIGYIPEEYENIEKVDVTDLSDELFDKYLSLYLSKLLEIYDEDKIILVRHLAAQYYLNKAETRVSLFDKEQVKCFNLSMERGFNYAKAKLKNCHVVDFPRGVIGKEAHKWGKAPLHYVDEYYDYSLNAMNIIMRGGGTRKKDSLNYCMNIIQIYYIINIINYLLVRLAIF